jgi:predicted anti-sigma-YlaC factor YlaD
MAEARNERMAQESATLQSFAHREDSEAAQKVSLLEGNLAVVQQARDTAEAKLLGLVDVKPSFKAKLNAHSMCVLLSGVGMCIILCVIHVTYFVAYFMICLNHMVQEGPLLGNP